MRRQGSSFGQILDQTDYNDAIEVARAIKAYQIEMSAAAEVNRQEHIQLELDRLDEWQNDVYVIAHQEHWKYNAQGDAIDRDYKPNLDAYNTLLKISKARVELLGLNEMDAQAAQAQVFIIQGETTDYVKSLQEIVQAG